MPSDRCREALGHIRENIALAREFFGGLHFAAFAPDIRTLYAVTRCPEIISGASHRPAPEVRERHAHLPWVQVARAGNVYRHEYDGLEPEMPWRTVHEALPVLLAAAEAELGAAP